MSDEVKPEELPTTGIDKDALIELPFPALIAIVENRFNIIAKLFDNQGAHVAIIDTTSGKQMASMTVGFGPTPEGKQVHDYWTAVLNDAGQTLWNALMEQSRKSMLIPQKKLHVVGANGAAH